MSKSFAMVCVLHGNPTLPLWIVDSAAGPDWWLCLVVNDAGSPHLDRYRDLPSADTIVWNESGRGFAENVNFALEQLPDFCNWVVIVNFDLELEVATLRDMIAYGDEVGADVVAPTLMGDDGRPTFSAGPYPRWQSELLRSSIGETRLHHILRHRIVRSGRTYRARHAVRDGTHRLLRPGEYLPWSCVAIRREALKRVGALDERFPLYGEDIDWGMRAGAAGLRQVLVGRTDVFHYGRATRSVLADTYYEVSNIRLHRKYGMWGPLIAQMFGLVLRGALRPFGLARPIRWRVLLGTIRSRGGARAAPEAVEIARQQKARHDTR